MEIPLIVNVQLFYGGSFKFINGKIEYVGGGMQLMTGICVKELTYGSIFNTAYSVIGKVGVPFVWYRKNNCWTILKKWEEVSEVIKSRDKNNNIDLCVTTKERAFEVDHTIPMTTNKASIAKHSENCGPTKRSPPKKKPIFNVPLRRSPRKLSLNNQPSILKSDPDIVFTPLPLAVDYSHSKPQQQNPPQRIPKLTVKRADKGKEKVVVEDFDVLREVTERQDGSEEVDVRKKGKGCGSGIQEPIVGKEGVVNKGKEPAKKLLNKVVQKKGKGVAVKSVTGKDKGVTVLKEKLEVKEKGKAVKGKGQNKPNKAKGKAVKGRSKAVDKDLDWEEHFEVSDDDDLSDLEGEVKFGIGEEELQEEELFEGVEVDPILNIIEKSLKFDNNVQWDEEEDDNSDELRSLQGSDDEIDSRPSFNPDIDFKRKVTLCVGLKFPDADILRKALVHHAIENRYDFYYLHSASDRITTYCRHRCKCELDKVRCKIVGCKCPKKSWCPYKIYATKQEEDTFWEIITMDLRHTCEFTGYTRKVTSEYLAERYLEEWREDPTWLLSSFQKRVFRELGIEVKYGVCWLARARAKLMIYGDGADQYARVWDYVAAVLNYNPGSTAIVMVDSIERPPPIFQRMYLCFKAVKDGFLAGCRPLVGVDGCHLKGAYPGMCLVAVGKDGNNNIYPIAWAVVEVENGATWSWFLKLLVEDLGKEEGQGLTFMSDRQKGLVDALKLVTPKAEVRYCVRHIWANFKLKFTGQVFKDTFWSAARCTTKAEFNRHMKGMMQLSGAAHAYLAAIPPQTWSRHAFTPNCKSNLLLNNICETFNSVLKDARDKPILTHMEWMRRYVMKRHSEKREGCKSLEGIHMPYVEKYMNWAEEEARLGTVLSGLNYEYEVDYRGEQHAVKLKEKTCTCYHWQLTGLPCPHAIACIIKNRGHPRMYVDQAYSKATYLRAYGQSISPMPGVKQWDIVGLDEPLPPQYRKLPGRPNQKKRKKEAGEGTSKAVKRPRRQRACGNCGVLGHNTKTCKNPTMSKENNQIQAEHNQQPRVARAKSKSEWAKKSRENIAKRKAQKEMTSAMAASIIQESQSSKVNVLDL